MTVYVPVEPLQESVELPGPLRVTLVGVKLHVRPFVGETAAASATLPVKPLTVSMDNVDVPVVPAFTITVGGLTDTVKSRIVKVTEAI